MRNGLMESIFVLVVPRSLRLPIGLCQNDEWTASNGVDDDTALTGVSRLAVVIDRRQVDGSDSSSGLVESSRAFYLGSHILRTAQTK